jgi:hypothetical protein
MQEPTEDLRENLQAQLDLAADLCRVGFAYSERMSALTADTMRKWVFQTDRDAEAFLHGDMSVLPERGRIVVDQWNALLACTLEFQKAFLGAFPKRK